MKWSIQQKTLAVFVVALGLVLLIDAVAFLSFARLTRAVRWQVHSREVLHDLNELLLFLQDAETGQRGFILTGDERYLDPYHAAAPAIELDFQQLRELTADNPRHQRRLDALKPLVDRKLAELQATIDAYRTHGQAAALAIIRTDEGKRIMDEIRAAVAGMEQAEDQLVQQRDARAARDARLAVAIISVGSVFGFAFLVLAMIVIHRDETKRAEAEEALRKAYDQLEVRVAERTAELARANDGLRSEIEQRARAETQLEDALRQVERSREDVISILDRLDLAVAMTDRDGQITFLSQAASERFGRAKETFLGKPWEKLFPLADNTRERIYAMMAHRPADRAKVPARVELSGGRHYWMEIEVQDDPHDAQRKIIFFHDVTEVYNLRRQLDEKVQFHDLVGKSEPMQRVFQQIRQLAGVDSTVLIEGQTGTGKELVARAIHHHSHRRDKPFIAVNIAGLTESLLASQLFGHRRGAFTGAVADQPGYFEAAGGGTIFLDEIGDIPFEMQTSLLRVLQEREVVRLGETRPRKIDVRVLAATQHDLNAEVEKGTFRADLLYRVRVARVQLPPLHQRREDIPLLVCWFLQQRHASTGKPIENISQDAMTILLDYHWPGNVRELKSAIEFAGIRCAGPVIQPEDLPPEILDTEHHRPFSAAERDDERQAFLDALHRAGGNRTEAARILGISRATFYRRAAVLAVTLNGEHTAGGPPVSSGNA
jgi:PAS domain S-box-containing protein